MKQHLSKSIALLLATMYFVSCNKSASNHENFLVLFISESQKIGARFSNTNIPPVYAISEFRSDASGFEILLKDVKYEQVEGAMLALFAPNGETFRPEGLKKSCLFNANSIGVALTVCDETNQVKIFCVRGVSSISPILRSIN